MKGCRISSLAVATVDVAGTSQLHNLQIQNTSSYSIRIKKVKSRTDRVPTFLATFFLSISLNLAVLARSSLRGFNSRLAAKSSGLRTLMFCSNKFA